jgi:hypothetical protein
VGVAAAAAAEVRRKRRRSSMGAISVPGKFVSEAIRWRYALLQFFQVDRVTSSDKRGDLRATKPEMSPSRTNFSSRRIVLQFSNGKKHSLNTCGAR